MTENLLWVDKYKPKNTQEIIGNKSNIQKITQWLKDWYEIHVYKTKEKPKFVFGGDFLGAKCVLVSGPPGIGKTSMVHLISKSLQYDIQEMNASDERNKSTIEKKLVESSQTNTLFKYFEKKEKKVIIMDEVDGMSTSDRGGITTLISLLKISKHPIICICNDRNKPALKSLINHCLDIRVSRPDKREILKRMIEIMIKENVNVDGYEMEKMIEKSGNDIRNVIHQLQMYSYTNQKMDVEEKMKKDDLSNLSIFESTKMILSNRTSFQTKYDLYFNDYDLTSLFIQENYMKPVMDKVNKKEDVVKLRDLALSSELLSQMDMIDSYSMKNTGVKDWRTLPVNAGLIASVGSVVGGNIGFPEFPQYLGKYSTQRKRQRYLDEMSTHQIKKIHKKIPSSEYRLERIPIYETYLPSPIICEKDVKKTIQRLDENGLDKEDFQEKLQDFYMGEILKEYKYETVDTKLKTAFTREWNKTHEKEKKEKKTKKTKDKKENDEDGEGEDDEELNEDFQELHLEE